jgi:hypothetical protein
VPLVWNANVAGEQQATATKDAMINRIRASGMYRRAES